MRIALLTAVLLLKTLASFATTLLYWGESSSSDCGDAPNALVARIYPCSQLGFNLQLNQDGTARFLPLQASVGNILCLSTNRTEVFVNQEFITGSFRDESVGLEETFVLDHHPQSLGIRFKLVGRPCELYFGIEYGQSVLGQDADALLSQDGFSRKASCPRGESSCSFKCAVNGFGVHFSAALLQAILVPRTQQIDLCDCGIGISPVDPGGTSISSGAFGPEQEWSFTAFGNPPYILTSINDDCAITYEVVRGRFLGIAAPAAEEVSFQCPWVAREEATAQLRLQSEVICDDETTGTECLAACATSGVYINEDVYGEDELPVSDLGCFSSRSREAQGCVCPIGNSSYKYTSQNISGWFGDTWFSAQGNRAEGVVAFSWRSSDAPSASRCRATFTVFQGTFLGVSAGESFLTTQRAKEAALAANILVGTGAGSAVVNSVMGAGTGGAAALSLIFQVQFLALATGLGGQRLVELEGLENKTLERLPSLIPEAVRTFAQRVEWVNFQGWGVFDFSPLCDTLAADAGDIFEVLCNCLLSLAGCSLFRLLYRALPRLVKKAGDHAGALPVEVEHADAAAFPSWELKLLQVEFQGISLATGAALGSRCSTYVNTGIAMVLCLLLVVVGLAWKLDKHMRGSSFAAKFEPDPAFRKYRRIVSRKNQHEGWVQLLKQKHSEFEALCNRGEWKLTSSDSTKRDSSSRSLTRSSSQGKGSENGTMQQRIEDVQFETGFRSLFEIYMGDRWWYGLWLFVKHLVQGVVLGTAVGTANWSVVLMLHLIDLGLMVGARPMVDSWDVFTEAHCMVSRLVLLVGAGTFLDGATDEATFGSIFLLTSIAGLVPTYTNTIVVEIPTLIYTVYSKFKGLKKEPEESQDPDSDSGVDREIDAAQTNTDAKERAQDVNESAKDFNEKAKDAVPESPVYVTQSPMDSGAVPLPVLGAIEQQLEELPRLDPTTLEEVGAQNGRDDGELMPRRGLRGGSEHESDPWDSAGDLRSSGKSKQPRTHVFKSAQHLRGSQRSATSRDAARAARDAADPSQDRADADSAFQQEESGSERDRGAETTDDARRPSGRSARSAAREAQRGGVDERERESEEETRAGLRGDAGRGDWRDSARDPAHFSFKLGRDSHWSRPESDIASGSQPSSSGKRSSRRRYGAGQAGGQKQFWDDAHDQLDDIVEGVPLPPREDLGGARRDVRPRSRTRGQGSSSRRSTQDLEGGGGEAQSRLSFQTAMSRSVRSEGPQGGARGSRSSGLDDGEEGRQRERGEQRRSSRRQRGVRARPFDAREAMRDLESFSTRRAGGGSEEPEQVD